MVPVDLSCYFHYDNHNLNKPEKKKIFHHENRVWNLI